MHAQRSDVRVAGQVGILGGGLWVVLILADVFLRNGLADSDARFRLWEAAYVVVQVLVLVGLLGFAGTHAEGSSRVGRLGIWLAIVARVVFLVGELHCLLFVIEDSPFLPLGALLTSIGMTMAGIGVLRAQRWSGWRRWVPLLTGLYPFVAMFPVVAATGEPSLPAIALWGVLWLALGYAVATERADARIVAAVRPRAEAVGSGMGAESR
jgi:hypothetical protein